MNDEIMKKNTHCTDNGHKPILICGYMGEIIENWRPSEIDKDNEIIDGHFFMEDE